jgi:hypothetical protein
MNRSFGILSLVVLLSGCSVETAEDAQQKCRDLVGDWCTKVYGCFVERGDVDESDKASGISDCKSTGEASIDCSAAVSTSDNYDTCMDAVHDAACSSIGSDAKIPTQCSGVIEISK